MIDREAIVVALFEKLKTASGFKKTSRRLKHWGEVGPTECPAMFLTQTSQTPTQMRGMPTVWDLDFEIYVYVRSPTNPNAVPQTQLNQILKEIELVFKPDPVTNLQTLNIQGVSHAWMSGTIETDEGNLGDLALAIIPVSVKAT